MSRWYTSSCSECGGDVFYLPEWSNVPKFCKECKIRNDAKWKVVSCKDCGTSFKVCIDWDKKPDFCKFCHERNKVKWKSKSCGSCGTKIDYHEDWENIPKFCKSCNEKRQAMWLKKNCRDCGDEFSYYKDWKNIPNFCKKCNDNFRKGWVDLVCANDDCRARFHFNINWLTSKQVILEYCDNCVSHEYAYLLRQYQSCRSYKLRTDLEFNSRGNQAEHIMRGSTGSHCWTGKFSAMNLQDIINVAAELARSTRGRVLEFVDKRNGNLIKYDDSSKLVVIFDHDRIVTIYLIQQGLHAVHGKLNRPDDTGWKGV